MNSAVRVVALPAPTCSGEAANRLLLETPGAPMARLQRLKRKLRRWLGEAGE